MPRGHSPVETCAVQRPGQAAPGEGGGFAAARPGPLYPSPHLFRLENRNKRAWSSCSVPGACIRALHVVTLLTLPTL